MNKYRATRLLITGGAGFIGSAVIRYLLLQTDFKILNLDKLTYAANPKALSQVTNHPNYQFKALDIGDQPALIEAFDQFRPDAVIHLAAESHVDRSIDSAAVFMQTNIQGTYVLLQTALDYWKSLDEIQKSDFRFLYVSTDEVFGDIDKKAKACDENASYAPSSPYSASKAAADHLVQAWYKTYGLPVLISHCSNNYGPYQDNEKLIPKLISNAIEGKPLPLYAKGDQIRDWIYVDDHVSALLKVLQQGKIGESYNIGGDCQITNIEVARQVCELLNRLATQDGEYAGRFEQLITFVQDRPGHDKRYAIDASKMKNQLGWERQQDFQSGLEKTVKWYLENL